MNLTELNAATIVILLLTLGIGLVIGWLVAQVRNQRRVAQLETQIEMEQKDVVGKLSELEATFNNLSNKALHANNQTFIQLAEQTFKRLQSDAKGELEQKGKAVDDLIKPIKAALEKTEQQIHSIEKERKEAYGSLRQYMDSMIKTQESLQSETRNLVKALRRPEVRGQWGELTLKRLVELAGMVQHCDFYEQETSSDGSLRPDMIVRMPDRREIVVDAKTPLDAYLSAVEADDDNQRKQFMQQHASNVRKRVRELAGKAYWNQFRNAPDFVILFIPGDQFLSSALEYDPQLLEDALRQQIMLTTPTSLVALLRAVAYGWRQETLAANADKVREVGVDLYRRLEVFADHLSKLGRSLDGAVGSFNKAVGSFEAKLLPGARKFTELGVDGHDLESPAAVEKGLRQPVTPEKET